MAFERLTATATDSYILLDYMSERGTEGGGAFMGKPRLLVIKFLYSPLNMI